jgi:hypothetical protein
MGASWAAIAEELVTMPMPALAPPGRISALALDLAFDDRGRILVVGGPLPAEVHRGLPPRLAVEQVSSFGAALERMDSHRYKLVIVSPRVREETDGVGFVRAFKAKVAIDGVASRIRSAYTRVPFLILPLEGDTEFAVFRTSSAWFLCSTARIPLLDAIKRWIRS